MAKPFINFRYSKHLSFFDTKAVIRAFDRGARRALSRFGAMVRGGARRNLRRRKRTAREGQAPSVHSKNPAATLRRIFFAYDSHQQRVVIGPDRLPRSRVTGTAETVPELLEEGGVAVRRINGRLQRVRYGKRPVMTPTFNQLHPELSRMFKNQVR